MIVTSVQIKTAKTQKHLYCLVFTQKACNHADYRLFYFCLKGKARTIFGFQGRKSAVLPGTDRTPAAAEVAALR